MNGPPRPSGRLAVWPSLPYVAPFALLLLLLWLGPKLGVSPTAEAAIRVTLLTGLLFTLARPVLSFRVARPAASLAVGAIVFVVWIGPDLLVPGWHAGSLFSNGIFGRFESTVPAGAVDSLGFLLLRTLRAVVLVPIIEELFWRAWLPRWIDQPEDFRTRPPGAFSRVSFWLTAVLFASEHGALWDVGLLAGIAYNEWMRRTRSLGDLILAHATTNALLSAYVVGTGKWEYW